MNGARPAAVNWQRCYTHLLVDNGFTVAKSRTCIMRHEEKYIDLIVHSDDFVAMGDAQDMHWFRGILETKLEISTVVIGHGPGDATEAKVLNRVIDAVESGCAYDRQATTFSAEISRLITSATRRSNPLMRKQLFCRLFGTTYNSLQQNVAGP